MLLAVRGARASDPMAKMMSLMSRMLDEMDTMGGEWSLAADTMLQGIHNESARIVDTAQLIDDYGTQIGWMADKIVLVEQVMSNLTRDCMCSNASVATALPAAAGSLGRRAALPPAKPAVGTVVESELCDTSSTQGRPTGRYALRLDQHRRTRAARDAHDHAVSESFWDPLFATMDHALALMAQMSSNMTLLMDTEARAIGSMSNNIVLMEQQIVVMGKRIGVMADRITATIGLMANATRACCTHRHLYHNHQRGHQQQQQQELDRVVSMPPSTPASRQAHHPTSANGIHDAPINRDATRVASEPVVVKTRRQRRRRRRCQSRVGDVSRADTSVSPADDSSCGLDPLCWAATAMGGMMDRMMDVISAMMTTCASDILTGTAAIGREAELVFDGAGLIQLGAVDIGKMADCIVEIERVGLGLFQEFCPGGGAYRGAPRRASAALCPPIAPIHPPQARAFETPSINSGAASGNTQQHSNTVAFRPAGHHPPLVTGPFGDFKAMVDLCAKMLETANHLSRDMLAVMGNVAGGVRAMAGEIGAMMGKMEQMAAQINNMIGRMATTAVMMEALEQQCRGG
eukprot:TRINITY_DN2335_c3_g1_i1.p1 TRINITY_DN2335_c3_g1~~TRINITY_DN2335_c3_g1_i1.p1  ORF type:complete len:635 (-),score=139.95 TRINITY_DN2335_c3_g1_i1:29-1753(-)